MFRLRRSVLRSASRFVMLVCMLQGVGAGVAAVHRAPALADTLPKPQAVFTPKQIADMSVWYDASNVANLSRFGANVAAWKDVSGNGYGLAQAATASEPTFTASGINRLGSIVFNGHQYLLSGAALSARFFNASTTFVVAQPSKGNLSTLLWSGDFNANPRWQFYFGSATAADFGLNSTSKGQLSANIGVDVPALWTLAGSVASKAQFLRKNGNVLATGAGAGASASGSYPLAVGAMAEGGHVSQAFTGEIGELVSFNRYLTSAESAEMEGYLACKWGLQNRLPANHPYRYSCPQGVVSPSQPLPGPNAGAITDPVQLRSSNGTLTFNVTAQANAAGQPEFVYGGSAVPPTLRLLPGDTLIVNLTNKLAARPAGSLYMNDVNLHYHGLHVSPQAPGDDSIDMSAAPGQSLHYVIHIPATHPTGLYWYHTHAHGETERQALAGMSGALIIDGIVKYAPQVANMPERILIARDAPLAGQALPDGDKNQMAAMRWAMARGAGMPGVRGPEVAGSTNASTHNPYVRIDPNYSRFLRPQAASTHCVAAEAPVKALTLNGATRPSIAIRPNELQFWRLVNASADTYLDVAIDRTKMNIIALDGVPLQSGVNTPASLTVTHWVLPPASRVEFTVAGPSAGTTAYLRTNCFDAGSAGDPMPAEILASIVSTSSPTDQAHLRAQRAPAASASSYRRVAASSLASAPIAERRTLYYSDQNTINGVAYDPSAPPMFYAQSGTVEEWTIQNNSSQVHTFHMHQVHFIVEAIDGVTQAQQYMLDNVNVPAATASGAGSVTVLLDFRDPTIVGTFLLHCHILSHEDGGMMAAIRVGTAAPLQLSSTIVAFASPTAAAQTVKIAGGKAPYGVSACNGVASASVSGTTLTLRPVAAGSCVLTLSDSSSPKITASITISVAAPAAVVTLSPAAVSFASPTSAAQNVTLARDTKPDTISGCTGIALAALATETLKVTPKAVGVCSFTITDAKKNVATLAVSVNAPVVGNALDNLTFHQNAARQGWYKNETSLTVASVKSANFAHIATLTAPAGMPAFGKVYAQPLYATNEATPDGKRHNLVVIATSTAQLYAFDDVTRAVVWHRDFTNAAAGVRAQLWSDTGCSDVNPAMGIVGTPVIDRSKDRLYVVVATMENGAARTRLHAVGLANGSDVVTPMPITGSAILATGGTAVISSLGNMNRSALLEANGNIYVSLASHCDDNLGATDIHGWEIAYNATTLTETGNVVDLSNANAGGNTFLGASWMGGYGPAADADGNVYFATGNGAYNGKTNFSESVMKFPGNLNLAAATWFTPASAAADGAADQDLGSGGVMLLPDQPGSKPHLAVAGGKCSVNGVGCNKFLLDRDAMGGQRAGDAGALWRGNTGGGMWGGPAYFADSSGAQYVIYGGSPSLNTYKVGVAPFALTERSSSPTGHLEGRDAGSQPIVSSNGTQAGTAVAWALQTPGNPGGTITLMAFDALNMGTPLFKGTAGVWTKTAGAEWIGGALVSPLVANGKVYVPTDGSVSVFGLK
jgi:suppressor of ftsI